MHVQSPKPPGRFSLRLAVYPPPQVSQTNGCLYRLTLAFHVVGGNTDSRALLLDGYCSASLLVRTPPPPSPLRPTSRVTGYTAYLAPPISRREEEGFSSCLARPCHRAAATTPPESSNRVSQPATLDAAFTLTVAGSASGAIHFRGHLCVRLRCGPVTCSHPDDDGVGGLQVIGFPPPCHPSYEASGFCLGGTGSRKTRQPLLDAQPYVT